MKPPETCKGCRSLNYEGLIVCKRGKYNHLGKCPCTICLVKSMCINGCKKYTTFYNPNDSKISDRR